MNIIYLDHNKPALLRKTVACIGGFDGFHKGHQALLNRVLEISEEKQCRSAVITFDIPPTAIFRKNTDRYTMNRHLMTLDQKLEYLQSTGIDYACVLRFTLEMVEMKPEEFVDYLNSLNIVNLVIGFDFTYGYMGKGNVNSLMKSQKRKFDVELIEAANDGGEKISTRRIVSLISNGAIYEANRLLGHNYIIDGHVRGDHFISKDNIIPKNGVFNVKINGKTRIIGIKYGYIMLRDESSQTTRIEFINEIR